jgi:hypothetical protein
MIQYVPFSPTRYPLHFEAYNAALAAFVGNDWIDGGAPGHTLLLINTIDYAANTGFQQILGGQIRVAYLLCLESIDYSHATSRTGDLNVHEFQENIESLLGLAYLLVVENLRKKLEVDPAISELVLTREHLYRSQTIS